MTEGLTGRITKRQGAWLVLFLLASIAMGASLRNGWVQDDGRWRVPAVAGLAVILLLGMTRSTTRLQVWRDRDTYLSALRRDASESWRTMVGAGIAEMESGHRVEGGRSLRAAVHVADSARRVGARAHTVRLPPIAGGLTIIAPVAPR